MPSSLGYAGGHVRERLRADLLTRLDPINAGLAGWAAWMIDQHRAPDARRNVRPPAVPPEKLNALHAQLLEELDRVVRS